MQKLTLNSDLPSSGSFKQFVAQEFPDDAEYLAVILLMDSMRAEVEYPVSPVK
jgi:hypothetical protein